MPHVEGQILLPEDAAALPPTAVVRVSLEDVSKADASSVVVAGTELRGVSGEEPVAFRLDVSALPPAAHYVVRVHVDLDGSGDVASGDLVSVQSHPVLTRGHGSSVAVPVRPVP